MFLLFFAFAESSVNIYLSENGTDTNDGSEDKPFLTISRAIDKIKEIRKNENNDDINVLLNEGIYTVKDTLVLDSSVLDPSFKLTFKSIKGKAAISGGKRITGWTKYGNLWRTRYHVPQASESYDSWRFDSMWVNEKRAIRARFPNKGDLEMIQNVVDLGMVEGQSLYKRHYYITGSIIPLLKTIPENVFNKTQIVILHKWSLTREYIDSMNESEKYLTVYGYQQTEANPISSGSIFYLENAMAFLDSPGEWYLDTEGWLYYYPRAGENIETAQIYVSSFDKLISVSGTNGNNYVQGASFENIKFIYSATKSPEHGYQPSQAGRSYTTPMIEVKYARNVNFTDCEITCTDANGIGVTNGGKYANIERCFIHEIGNTGVMIGTTSDEEDPNLATNNTVSNCIIADGSQWIHDGVGVWIGQAAYNNIIHNEICNFLYTGVSFGWRWGYAAQSARYNVLKYNHIHHIGMGYLSDMGGVYTLGPSEGTHVSCNMIHDIYAFSYGGWGLYTDEGSSHITIENNLVYNTQHGSFHQHYGMNNTIRNNILAFAEVAQIQNSQAEDHISFTISNNIIVYNDTSVISGSGWTSGNYSIDNNIYYNYGQDDIQFLSWSLDQWHEKGNDVHSIFNEDPLFADPFNHDFRLKDESVSSLINFKVFNFSDYGIYGEESWIEQANSIIPLMRYICNRTIDPMNYSDNFEEDNSLFWSALVRSTEQKDDAIVISDERAHSGNRSMKITDGPDFKYQYNPHFYWLTKNYNNGNVTCSFWISVPSFPSTDNQYIYAEWRTNDNPYKEGPRIIIRDDKVHIRSSSISFTPNEWIYVEMKAGLGDSYTGNYSTLIRVDDKEIYENRALDEGFTYCGLVLFSSNTKTSMSWYVDDIDTHIVTPTPLPTPETPQPTIQATPQQTIPETPQQTIQATPQQTIPETPQQTIQATPQQTIQATPQQTIQATPQQTIPETPQPTISETPQPTNSTETHNDHQKGNSTGNTTTILVSVFVPAIIIACIIAAVVLIAKRKQRKEESIESADLLNY